MAIKKSELYSSLWASCDELRGGMDASQYKDYVLVMLFIKYISDKYVGILPFPAITVPEGARFQDMVALKGHKNIGDNFNKKILAPIAEANKLAAMPDFNDKNKLGSGKEMVDRLTNLIAIFENPALDFSNNRADGDDILGDAYEYLMRHFATESGKSKGQFYTPAEVSRIMAKIIGINKENAKADTTVYDPTCGSGSLLLKVGEEAQRTVTLLGQEKDSATAGLARMNMILHNNPTAEIKQGNTLAKPLFEKKGNLQTFDYVVANPPFSDKRWSNGLKLPEDAPYNRFADYGIPPDKNGDYAYLLHIVRSLKRHGKGAVILPHGVLFRGNAETEIRKTLIRKGYIKGIIGLPANLFYGTGIPAAIILLDKENAHNRKGIFMIDAGKGFVKDGNKNRLREQDSRKITDVFNAGQEIAGYSRMVSVAEIEANEFNLNIPRYIDSQTTEDVQDIEAHLKGGIPNTDIEALAEYWAVYPTLKRALFKKRKGYSQLKADDYQLTIKGHPEFVAFGKEMDEHFEAWKTESADYLRELGVGDNPKEVIHRLAENLLQQYADNALIDKYDIYQHLMSYWFETMQDDCYIVSAEGWKAETYRITVKNKAKKKVNKGWACDLVPKDLLINRYFQTEQQTINQLTMDNEQLTTAIEGLVEEHSSEDGYFAELEKVNKANVQKRLRQLAIEEKEEIKILKYYLDLLAKQAATNQKIKEAEKVLDAKLYAKYPTLDEDEVKTLVVEDKWMQTIEKAVKSEIDQISQRLTNRIKELVERYEIPLPVIDQEVNGLEGKVNAHLEKMGFVWN